MINSLFTGNRNSLLAWPWLYPGKQQDQPVFSPMPFDGGMTGNKGAPVMAGGMPYPRKHEAPTMWAGGSQDWLGNQGTVQGLAGYGGLNTGQAPVQYNPYGRQASGGMRRPGGMAIRQWR